MSAKREKKANIAVLISGGGTNLQAILDAEKSGLLHSGSVRLVISNRKGAYGLERAALAGVKAVTVTKKDCGSQEAFEQELIRQIDAAKKAGYVKKGDNIVLTAGVPLGVAGNTNMTRVIEVW